MTDVGSSPALVTCETSHVLLAGVSGGFPGPGTPVSPHLPIGSSRYECNDLERDVKLNKKKSCSCVYATFPHSKFVKGALSTIPRG